MTYTREELTDVPNDLDLDLVICPNCDDYYCLTHDLHYWECECPSLMDDED